MKKAIYAMGITVLLAMVAANADNQASRWLSPNDPTARLITVVETMWTDANCGPQPAVLNAAIADDFQGTSTQGARYAKSEALKVDHDRDCRMQAIHIRQFGESLAMAYGNESSLVRKGGGAEEKRCLAWTDTWLKRNGKWQIVAAQDNVVDCK
ncbi:MAG: nuclear transport factor 2 family protein [Gammaproteobacteria bacterium]|nr:nuclear transport factor 2 family protein [Gammaproteobacteria bacterium]